MTAGFLVLLGHLFALSSHGGKDEGALWSLFYKDSDPTHEGGILMSSSNPNYIPKAPSPWGLGFNI